MRSDASERRPSCRTDVGIPSAAAASQNRNPPPPNLEALPCPRCDSINTKFCYYNNYNLAQPRHFCKSCRRYWTQGGTLRNVPVGGGSRKSAASSSASKRLRSIPSSVTSTTFVPPSTSSPASTSSSLTTESLHPPTSFKPDIAGQKPAGGDMLGAFTSLLTTSHQGGAHLGFLASGGFGPAGYGVPSLDGLGLSFSRTPIWPFAEVGYIDGVYAGGGSSSVAATTAPPCNTWQLGPAEGGGGGGGQVDEPDGFTWPELAISMPGQGLK
ncbi:hypothetical protein SAY86_016722 [Trapa natans]|uniref:Dof zinc finger protein n=1 Tax=Trapa natans TaxID=22666 RepID=A0AAN7LK84_TRANT|nr:hypothetical protein SAY86_016722 [Trapa natans]